MSEGVHGKKEIDENEAEKEKKDVVLEILCVLTLSYFVRVYCFPYIVFCVYVWLLVCVYMLNLIPHFINKSTVLWSKRTHAHTLTYTTHIHIYTYTHTDSKWNARLDRHRSTCSSATFTMIHYHRKRSHLYTIHWIKIKIANKTVFKWKKKRRQNIYRVNK